MSGRPKRRGRPPKPSGSEKPKFQMHLLKKPKYLQEATTIATSPSTATATTTIAATPTSRPRALSSGRSSSSRRSAPSIATRSPATSGGTVPSRSTRRSSQKRKAPATPSPAASKPKTPRPSTSKKSKKSAPTPDKGHDYHYGSDFDDSDNSEDPSESEQSDTNIEDVDEVSDSDFSLSSFSVASRARKSNVSYIRNPSPEPLWVRDEEISKLELPKSSEDLLVPNEHIMQSLCIYEVLRRFKSQVNYHIYYYFFFPHCYFRNHIPIAF